MGSAAVSGRVGHLRSVSDKMRRDDTRTTRLGLLPTIFPPLSRRLVPMQLACSRDPLRPLIPRSGLTAPSGARTAQKLHSTRHPRHHPSHHSHSESSSRAPARPPNLLKTTRAPLTVEGATCGCAHVGSLERGDDGRGSDLATQRTQSQRYELSWLCEEEKQELSMGRIQGGGVGEPGLGVGRW